MATPARKTSKTRRNQRRAAHKITAPAIHYDTQTGEYVMSHHVSPNGVYNGKQIIKEAN
ncbi:MAG: 50S ribosomal protein L32 [Furfurilactobacillus sp.]|uniref:Large ribosomal subunit protein bL32 n=1 Tax=Furfurilactobacillus milii TaxID=2888272 RepID=A0ABT6D6S8_9LACO|nr:MULTISPECIES: 50S ribosomal protein L32 [Furfurilactobacillus]QLE66428.1 LSU ribosomal protein L32p [Furfurilactobacillus rossiae]MCF6159885.1 50S ribosomal protein L32 [Furfurilactobacillus milii]MCF6162566.1 50S ribosomal protein L32 [Furfurilactobacillus milii]MCF6419263.1 50S ribosomal protein L32 [Furfurilactobacillus milii]MCH4010861.1 50S ribosomal protein L32 [Furfurilactobacillus sp.]